MNTVCFQLLFVSVYCTTDFDYYMNLIQTEEERSETFILPTDSQSSKPYSNAYIEYATFDHIVIGAGSAGAIVATRLSEDPFRDVLVLEAGGYETNFTDIPGVAGTLLNLEYNWNYRSVPQTTCCLGMLFEKIKGECKRFLGMDERRCAYPRGKAIGGTSVINSLIYSRGNKRNYDMWCELGNPGWCYHDVLPFFKMSENSKVDGDAGYHGHGGYLNVELKNPGNRIDTAFVEANLEVGRPLVDYNGKRQSGVSFSQHTQKNGRRCSSGKILLQADLNRKNLKILTHSHVVRLLINNRTKHAYGVLYAKDNKYYVARSRRDIVLSAGAIASPQLLMLSGIGPKQHLHSMGILVFQDLQVGENFQDHASIGLLHFVTNISRDSKTFETHVRDYLKGVGILTDAYSQTTLAFIKTNVTKTNCPDVELIQIGSQTKFSVLKAFFNFELDTYNRAWTNFDFSRSLTVYLSLLHSESRGYVKLNSADPFEYPNIHPNSLSDPNNKDIDTLYEGIQLALQLLQTETLKKIGARLHRIHLPACKDFEYLSKDYWFCHIRQTATPFSHPVGTCKMGPNPLQGAVVDHKLKVHGIKNLRVADASIMPVIPAAHINAPAIMIGEKAAHMIRFD